jgi:hypothetical protein
LAALNVLAIVSAGFDIRSRRRNSNRRGSAIESPLHEATRRHSEIAEVIDRRREE